ncbi:MAG: Uma2 family endonuclease [Cyanobacteria bacterium P01_D01_bin.156]
MTAINLNLEPLVEELNHEQFYKLCMANKDIAMERSSAGKLIIMSPVGGESGRQEANYIIDLGIWNRQTGLGEVFNSSTIFNLPNGGDRSPDAAWVQSERWNALTPEQRTKFPPICPDFVIELRSQSDRLKPLQEKMKEYLDSGLRLGFLINPQGKTVEIYRAGQTVEVMQFPTTVSGEDVLPGFSLTIEEKKIY